MDRTIDRDRWQRISAMFDAVLDMPLPDRERYLNEACGDDPGLRGAVEELLAANAASSTFLAVPAIERAAALVADVEGAHSRSSRTHLQGRIVGSYRIVRELGEGGMGVVCLAERADGQFEQRVAIKLVKQGLHSEQARQRFLQERRILARLEHPAIARLLDGGVTDEGTPFFVMECVDGQPITSYCAEHALSVNDRLQIFLQICDAVQYAHRNLIVHRDLKPSNILVNDSGGVKLLDFGIAKLLGDDEAGVPGSPQTIGRALTPEYAAPEQLRGEPVGTTADVYALGVLLYELLTGERPYRLRGGITGEVERAILEQEPLPPSLRVPARDVRRQLRGDLDRVLLKALQKSPDRRYSSAEAIAADVRRHLQGLPVSAQGDALSYRARKFFGRHRVGAGVAALLLFTLVGGLVATTWQARRAEREARKAEAVKEFLKSLFSAADPERTKGGEPSIRQLLDDGALRIESELRNQPDVQSEVALAIGTAYQSLGEYDRAARLFRADLARRRQLDGPRSLVAAQLLTRIADAVYEQNRFAEAGAMYEEALSIEREKRGEHTVEVAELLWDIAGVTRNRGNPAGAEALDQQSLAIYVERKGADSNEAAGVRESLSILYMQAGRFAEAAALQAAVAAMRERRLGADHPHTLNSRYNLAYCLEALGRFEEALRISEDVVTRQRRVLGPRHDRFAVSLRVLGRALDSAGRAEEAVAPTAEALAIQTAEFGAVHLQVATDRVWQALIEAHIGQLAKAEQDAREALTFFDSYTGAVRADLPHMRTLIGIVLAEAGRLDEADAQVSRAASDLRAVHLEGAYLGLALDALGDIARRRQQPARARDLTTEALTLLERGLGDQHAATALARVHAGAARWSLGETAEGEPLTRRGLASLEQQFPDGHPDLAAARLIIGDLLRQSGRPLEARPMLQKALAWREVHFGPADPRTAAARQALRATKP